MTFTALLLQARSHLLPGRAPGVSATKLGHILFARLLGRFYSEGIYKISSVDSLPDINPDSDGLVNSLKHKNISKIDKMLLTTRCIQNYAAHVS